jgi:hypothetical protein
VIEWRGPPERRLNGPFPRWEWLNVIIGSIVGQ